MNVFVSDKIDTSAIEKIKAAGHNITEQVGLSADELKKALGNTEVLAIRSATKVTADIMDAVPSLKLVVRAGVGLDNVDLAAAKTKGIEVRNTPGATAVSVAEHVLGLMLSLVRNIPSAHAKLSKGTWDKAMGSELSGKTIGILGLGRIGQEVAKRCQAFGMKVIAADPYLPKELADKTGIPMCSSSEMLKQVDFVTLHLPFTPETKNMINAENIACMKKGSFIVNCARGGIVDEAAVADAVKSGHLAGAAFDVFATEPLKTSPLMEVEGIILTPHLGASTTEGQARAGDELADIIISFGLQK